jgi:regulator of protease activity HflC (stomatin/prohibitin superfamily)
MTAAVVFLLLGAVIVLASVRVVPAGKRAIVYRLGKALPQPKGPGLVIIAPVIDKLEVVETAEQSVEMMRVAVVSNDNEAVTLEGTVRFRILDPVAASTQVADLGNAVATLAQTSARLAAGEISASDVTERATGERIRAKMDAAAKPWGVQIVEVSVRRAPGLRPGQR